MVDRTADNSGVRVDPQTAGQVAGAIGQLVAVWIMEIARYVQTYVIVSIVTDLIRNCALGLWLIVDRSDRNDELCRRGATPAISDRVSHGWHNAIPVRYRRKAVTTIGVERQFADTYDGYAIAGIVVHAVHCE